MTVVAGVLAMPYHLARRPVGRCPASCRDVTRRLPNGYPGYPHLIRANFGGKILGYSLSPWVPNTYDNRLTAGYRGVRGTPILPFLADKVATNKGC